MIHFFQKNMYSRKGNAVMKMNSIIHQKSEQYICNRTSTYKRNLRVYIHPYLLSNIYNFRTIFETTSHSTAAQCTYLLTQQSALHCTTEHPQEVVFTTLQYHPPSTGARRRAPCRQWLGHTVLCYVLSFEPLSANSVDLS